MTHHTYNVTFIAHMSDFATVRQNVRVSVEADTADYIVRAYARLTLIRLPVHKLGPVWEIERVQHTDTYTV